MIFCEAGRRMTAATVMSASWPFRPVIADWPRTVTVLDLSAAIPDEEIGFAIGRYAERRVGVYTTTQFVSAGEVRDVHVGVDLFAIWGHLSRASLAGKAVGSPIRAGEVVGHLGDRAENGGWPPHLHLQLSFERPETHDLPGVVCRRDLPEALLKFPDPRLVLGPIY
jgi:hypothetical protein